jgi:hypothetical protein
MDSQQVERSIYGVLSVFMSLMKSLPMVAWAGLTALGGSLTALDRNVAENLRSLPREGPRQGQRA